MEIFLLFMHLLEPLVNVDTAIHHFQDFYLYAGFDCTFRWATYLRDEPRRQAMTSRLRETLGVTEMEIQSCLEKVVAEWAFYQVADALGKLLDRNSEAPLRLRELFSPAGDSSNRSQYSKACPEGGGEDTNPVILY